ncbi:MAG: S8 family serine peptidase [Alphaproteobacteria bacterium]|nr:S8 family serine peptidase [Alphaproteobacteria bacterium]
MQNRRSGRSLLVLALVFGGLLSLPQKSLAASPYPYMFSPQNGLLGLNEDIWASANYGAGITYGVIDTGVAAPWIGFQDRVDTASAACTIAGCSSAYDDNGHGTFVASEIAGDVRQYGLVGLAPAGTILPVKVLNAQGSGTFSDVAEGISYAADHGANVLNLSMTFIPTPEIVSAINGAAAKNVVIVFAGGNSSQAFLNGATVSGFTDAAIQHMIFMGSTNANLRLSSFSNRPGSGGFRSTTNKFYKFSSRWMMADGEHIIGASTYHDADGYTYITQMSGTSMAAPQAAGAAGLLAARWPFLLTDGTVDDILLASTQDLGTRGRDSKFGQGFLRIDKAFSPVGALKVLVNNNKVAATNGAFVAGGAFGSAAGISSAFSKAVGYDKYSRDFAFDVSSAIRSPAAGGISAATAQVQGQTGVAARGLTDLGGGAWFAASSSGATDVRQADWSVAFQQDDGSYLGAGHGPDAAVSFNDARWGGKTAFFNRNDSMAGNLLGLTSSADFTAVGMDLDSDSHLAFGGMTSEAADFASLSGQHPAAQGAAVSYTARPAEGWVLSLSNAFLREDNMLLGSLGSGYLGLGQTSTVSVGLGASVDLGSGYSFGVDTIAASTGGTHHQDSLMDSTSHLRSAGVSMVMNKENLTGVSDNLGFSIKKPLRVYGGSAHVNVPTGADSDGNPIIHSSNISLVPSGNETDFGFNYRRPLAPGVTSGFDLSFRQDADHVAGAQDAAAMVHFSAAF